MKKRILSTLAIFSLIFATNLLTACDDDDDNDETTGNINGYEYVDLGLSVKWATVNIGATLPADYGNYYAWGETETKDKYTEDNSVTYGDSSFGDISGNATYDAATANWGKKWRMPTRSEFEELLDDCTWTFTTQENSDGEEINGYLVEGTNGNFIFLPDDCSYWSSTPYTSSSAYYLFIRSIQDYPYQHFVDNDSSLKRYEGLNIRPVSD